MAKTLTLKRPADPAKLALSLALGWRFVDRKGRYILQGRFPICFINADQLGKKETSWVDVPLVPETYGEAQA